MSLQSELPDKSGEDYTCWKDYEGRERIVCTVAVNIPDAVLYDIRMSSEEAQRLARRATALALYTQHEVSLGYCAQVAHMSKADFMLYLSSREVSVYNPQDEEELNRDIDNALWAAEMAHGE